MLYSNRKREKKAMSSDQLSFNASIHSDFNEKDLLIEEIGSLLWNSSVQLAIDAFELRLILDESLSNAIEHGNRFDKSKRVQLKLEVEKSEMVVSIIDEGIGFEFLEVMKEDHHITMRRGRGLKIISRFAEIEWNEVGNEIILHIKRSAKL